MAVKGRRRWSALFGVALMGTGGWVALGLTVLRGPVDLGAPGLWVYGGLVLLGEVLLASTPTYQTGINTSTVFALALLLRSRPPSAVLALATASVVASVVTRRRPGQAICAVAVYSLALLAAGGTMQTLANGSLWSGIDHFRAGQLPAIAAVGLIFVFVEVSVTGLVNALLHDAP